MFVIGLIRELWYYFIICPIRILLWVKFLSFHLCLKSFLYCFRIRPQIPRELIDMCRICTTVTPGEPQVTLGSDKAFTYDYVFDMEAQQEDVYTTCVETLVNGSLEGYNATVLAYGQTGSGKTYTMGTGFDVEVQPDQVGIIPRAINHLFNGIQNRADRAREAGQPPPEFKIVAQFMELYNEEVIDLFDPSREQFATKGKSGIKIHEDASGGIYVVGVTMKPVMSADDALQCLRNGALSRTTASTQMNSQSSRSHAIFTLHIKQQRLVKIENADDADSLVATDPSNEFETLTAKFHFVDLAGSERLKRTGATGERAKEGISINCGLLALGNVISALGDKSRKALHVPYRDSKLTRLLQDSLGGEESDVTEMIQGYLKEIEELRAKLLESEAICQQLRKTASRSPPRGALSPHVAMSGNFDISLGDTSSVGTLIAEAKKGLRKDIELLSTKSSRGLIGDDIKKNGVEPTDDGAGEDESENSDSEGKTGENEDDSDSDTDTEEKEEETAQYGLELAELTSEIDIKQKLIEELERSQKRIQLMRQHYEDKLQLLQERIRATQEERDTVLASFKGQTNQPTEKERKVREEYERKLFDMQKEMKKLLSAKKEHARLLRNQTQSENQVKLLNKMKEEAAKHKDVELRRNREIAQLRKESRKRENTIRSLEAEKRVKEAVLKRKQEEVTALRKMQRGPLSNKAAGRVGPRHGRKKANGSTVMQSIMDFFQKLWPCGTEFEKVLLVVTDQAPYILSAIKQLKPLFPKLKHVTSLAHALHRGCESIRNEYNIANEFISALKKIRVVLQLQQREELGRSLDQLMRRRDHALISRHDSSVIRDLEDQIESMKANIDYVQESIAESQQNIMQIEESKDNLDTLDTSGLMQGLSDIDSKYLIEKLYNMTINQSYSAAQKELIVKEMEAKLNEFAQRTTTQQQLLEHLLSERANKENIDESTDSSANSSRSTSPTDTCNGNVRPSDPITSTKIRRRTALPEDLLYPIISSATQDRLTITELPQDDDTALMPPPQTNAIVRLILVMLKLCDMSESRVIKHLLANQFGRLSKSIVPSRPDHLKPSPVPSRKVYDRQDSTSPRLTRRTVNLPQGSLLGKPGSM
ncbi:hypothetical protein C0J52_18156 [Blattella germanica]|nr:hypothetical protein C0J52_18156 [Blattella germanica]